MKKTLDWAKLAIDLFFPDPSGKPRVAANVAGKVSKEAAEAAEALEHKFGDALAKDAGAKATGQVIPDAISPTYRELQGLNKGFQAHHTLPQYLGKMLGYTKGDMLDHPATLITQYSHTARINPGSMHAAINQHLPPMAGGKKVIYTADQIKNGLRNAYDDIGRPELFESIKHLIK